MNPGAPAAASGTHPGEPLALEDRVFFHGSARRHEALPELGELPFPSAESLRIVPLRGGRPAPLGRLGALPVVPKLLSEPSPGIDALEKKMHRHDMPLLRLEALRPTSLPAQPRVCAMCGTRRMSSAPDRAAMSSVPLRTPIASHSGDPLAAPELDADGGEAANAALELVVPFVTGGEAASAALELVVPFVTGGEAASAALELVVPFVTGGEAASAALELVVPFVTGAEAARAAPEFIMPFANGRVTSLFNQGRRHPAIDLAGALGSPVLATTARQTVVFAGRRGGYGNLVVTRDANGRTHLYGHLKSITSRVGRVLDQGETLGHLGSTGRSTGPHVHYEVKDRTGRHINPVRLLFAGQVVRKGHAWLDPRHQERRPATTPVKMAAQPR